MHIHHSTTWSNHMSNTMTRSKKLTGTAATFLMLFVVIAILKRFQR